MHLTPHELDKLTLHQAGFLAQKRLARGVRLNYPEAIALIATQLLEFIRDGQSSVAELMDLGRRFLGHADVMEGVPEMIHEVQIEGTFPDGSKLVTVHNPIVIEYGELEFALYGTFLPIPPRRLIPSKKLPVGNCHISEESFREIAEQAPSDIPGQVFTESGELELNANRETVTLAVTNRGDRPIQVGSHYQFIETNRALAFDRDKSYGMRLDIPAGTAVRFEPGETKTIDLVAIGGNRIIHGGNSLAGGLVNEANRTKAMDAVKSRGFK